MAPVHVIMLPTTGPKIMPFARQHYNDSVRRYNTKLEQVPTNVIKNFGDFPAQEFFEIEDPAQKEAPKVQF